MKLETISLTHALTNPGWSFGRKLLLVMKLTILIIVAAFLLDAPRPSNPALKALLQKLL